MAKVKIDKNRCKGCYLCIANCPNGALKISDTVNVKGVRSVYFAASKCAGCGMCVLVCPDGGIKVYK